ncbi:MAG: DUF2897 domain-containing protein [Vibrio sp.]
MMDLILEPWFISIVVIVFILGNLATLKYLGKSNLIPNHKKKKTDLDKLLEHYRDENSPLSKLHQESNALKQAQEKNKSDKATAANKPSDNKTEK